MRVRLVRLPGNAHDRVRGVPLADHPIWNFAYLFAESQEGQLAFARRIGVLQSTLQRLEIAVPNVGLDTLETICARFHCEIGDLSPPLTEAPLPAEPSAV